MPAPCRRTRVPPEHAVHRAGERVRHRSDRLGCPELAAQAAVLGAEVALAPQQGGGGESKGGGRSIDDVSSALSQHAVAADAIVWTQTEPRREMGLGGPARHVDTDFAHDGLCDADIDAVNPCQVHAADPVQFTTEVNWGAWLPAFRRRLGVCGAAGGMALPAMLCKCCSSAWSHSAIRCWYASYIATSCCRTKTRS